jgi:lysozyme
MDSRLIADIKQAEGFSLKAYKDTKGLWTIGYGHLLPDQSKDYSQYTITQIEADEFLKEDITLAGLKCLKLPEWPSLDTSCRKNAVIELVFNLGDKWKQFAKTRLDIQNKEWKKAHDDLLDSLWAKEVGSTRSNRLANYLLTGEYTS